MSRFTETPRDLLAAQIPARQLVQAKVDRDAIERLEAQNAQYDAALKNAHHEIERLRAENLHCEHQMEISRNATIEECARLCESYSIEAGWAVASTLKDAAAKIRALKN